MPVQLIVTSIEDQPLTGEELRSLPMGRLNAALRGEDLATAIERRWESKRAWNFAPTGMSTRQTLELAVPASRQAVSLKVEKSPTRKQPDAFYERVTSAYDAVRRTSSRPVAELAEANGVPASTIHRWLDEGRRRAALEAQAGSG